MLLVFALGHLIVFYFLVLWFRTRPVIVLTLIVLDSFFVIGLHCRTITAVYLVICYTICSIAISPKITETLDEALNGRHFLFFAVSALSSLAIIYIYLPVTIFLTSPQEIKIHVDYLLNMNVQHLMLYFYGCLFLYSIFFKAKYKSIAVYASAFILTIFLLYAFVLPFGYPIMNGLLFEQIGISLHQVILRILFDVAVFLGVGWSLAEVLAKRPKFFIQGILIVNFSLMIATYIKVTEKEINYFDKIKTVEAENLPLKYSQNGQNVLLIMLDRYMGGFIERILEEEPQLKVQLEGFVWYPRTVSAGVNSIAGVHPLLGGYDYTPYAMNKRGEDLVKQSAESYTVLPFNFSKANYQVNFVNPNGLGFTQLGECSYLDFPDVNCTHVPTDLTISMAEEYNFSSEMLLKSNYSDLMVILGVMRVLPYGYKHILNKKGPWQPFLDHSAGTTFKEWSELKGLPLISTNQSERDNLNIFFNILPHEPYFLGSDCLPRQEMTTFSVREYTKEGFSSLFAYQHYIAAKCSLKIVAEYFEWMKANGVYDNTRIALVSDHGIVGRALDQSSRAQEGETTGNFFVASRSLLLIKDRNATGEIRISEDFVPNASLPEILCEDIGGCVNPYLGNKPIISDGRDDPFRVTVVPWQFNQQKRKAFSVEREFELRNKDPFNAKNWREVRPGQ